MKKNLTEKIYTTKLKKEETKRKRKESYQRKGLCVRRPVFFFKPKKEKKE